MPRDRGVEEEEEKSEKYWGPRRNEWAGAVMAVRTLKAKRDGLSK